MDRIVGIVGSGRVAVALETILRQKDVRVLQASRKPEHIRISDIGGRSSLLVIAVSDDAIDGVARDLANAAVLPDIALHTSGAAGPDALARLRERGVATGVLHPLQTVPNAEAGVRALPGSSFAFAGDPSAQDAARDLVGVLGGKPLAINPDRWHFYHAAAVMASNYQVALMDAALELMEGAGVDRAAALEALAPLARQANANILSLGTDAALTGPIRRGDLGTVLRHMRALRTAPAQIRNLYVAAARQTLKVAERSGLSPAVADEIEKSIAQGAS